MDVDGDFRMDSVSTANSETTDGSIEKLTKNDNADQTDSKHVVRTPKGKAVSEDNVTEDVADIRKEEECLEVLIEVNDDTTKAPDGGWGWMIVLGILLIRTIVGGFVRSSGLFFVKFSERFGESAANTAWVTSLSATVRLLVGPGVSILCNRFSSRKLIYFGSALFVIGVHISAYANTLEYLYFSYGVLAGLGRSFVLTPLIILLGEYFDKRRSLAFGLASAGFGLGGFAITPAIEVMFQQYGFRGTYILLSGIACHFFVFTSLLRPLSKSSDISEKIKYKEDKTDDIRDSNDIENKEMIQSYVSSTGSVHLCKADRNASLVLIPQEVNNQSACNKVQHDCETNVTPKTKKKLINFSVLKDIRFVTLCMATFIFTLPSSGLFLPVLAKSRGVTDIQAAYLLSIISGSDIISRVFSGFVLDLKSVRNLRPFIYNLISFIQCISLFLFPSLKSFEHFCAVCVLHGAVMGCKAAQRSVILVDILGVDKLSSSNAFLLAVQGIGTLVGPPVSGELHVSPDEQDHFCSFLLL
ncbi:monocarboxylate transporter 12-like [Ruditapes philippinarum]|uniref:monocarboxylate transporter 12-like n=1 Tax=Ruditapes philippinarum TaxID=129788 RepID=UPI00295A8A20|nr:monocarboxylate transporter 12-like [Ruditapes philippinarum]